ncbi:hypothetical protein Goshw_021767 [Gossypium schwendimanii]|uniref:U2A'/phosphoprotein 32 family A C-terminal domain-containing protein n=1 Tax=Gossypium schwendimanii TaxID=34291 RepID=A0A7J9LQ91_GOSSC|nr:hypothetical protein [Gossypium schwendimanii]
MDEIWQRAVETALDGQADHAAVRTLTLDGAVKCVQGRLPPPSLLEKFENLQHLSIANIGVSSLEQFPRLRNLQRLILSDNRIAGGLEFLVEAGLDSLRDLDLSNNRIQYIEALAPLAQLKLVSLDLYECPVTRVKDYRSRVFGLIKSLKYLDKMDAEENERPESDDEEEEEDEEDEDEDDEDDPGSGEVDGDDRQYRMNNGHSEGGEGIVDVDEDEESDADEEETDTGGRVNGLGHEANGFRIEEVGRAEDEDDDGHRENDSGEEVDDEEEEEDVVEVHDIGDSDDDEEDGVEDDDEEEEDEDEEEEEVDNDEGDFPEPESTGHLMSTEGEIDGHEHGEDGDDDDHGETGEEELDVEEAGEYEDEEEGEEEDEDYGEGYLVQPVAQAEEHDAEGSDMDPGNEEEEDGDDDDDVEEEEEVEDDEEVPSTSQLKRKRSDDAGEDKEEDDVKFSKKHG